MSCNSREVRPNNREDRDMQIAKQLLYSQFPTKFVWKKKQRQWPLRKKGFKIGRLLHVPPSCGELYFMRIMLNHIKGLKSFEHIRTVNHDIVRPTYRDACYALGLIGDDKEYIDVIEEASDWGSGSYLRHLFSTLLLSCTLSMPSRVWDKTWRLLSYNILHRQRRILNNQGLQLTDEELQNYTLLDIENFLQINGSSLHRFEGMPLPDISATSHHRNNLVMDELSYDRQSLREEHDNNLAIMTDEQRLVYNEIVDAVLKNKGGVFFVYGYGGTGKTFIWRTLCAAFRCKGGIVLPVASSGIAATLIPGDRTAHSRFGIPLSVTENSTCPRIKPGSDLTELMRMTKLIIWDEAPMTHKHSFEALDRSLKDVMRVVDERNADEPFGGKVVVFGGDFRQILPVVPKGIRADIVHASLCSSYLWSSCKVLKLTKNMRLQVGSSSNNGDDIKKFSEWILEIGDGLAGGDNTGEVELQFPLDLLIEDERAILAPTHEIVDEVNDYVLSLIDKDERIYLSSDEVSKDDTSIGERDLHSTEFLNSIKCSGLPNHQLRLKIGAMVMLLRNIDQSRGLCNGTRLIVTALGTRVIRCTVLTGSRKGTFDAKKNTGGANGTVRLELSSPPNKGIKFAVDVCEQVKVKHPRITYADLFQLAGVVAVEATGGPIIQYSPGRPDSPQKDSTGNLPNPNGDARHLRDVLGKMGFSDREIVALSGSHTLGRAHQDRSGFDGPFTKEPLKFDNSYYVELLQGDTPGLVKFPTDKVLIQDPVFRQFVQLYAQDEKKFFEDYAEAHKKMSELGVFPPSVVEDWMQRLGRVGGGGGGGGGATGVAGEETETEEE
ncbi:hypothetical protein KSS87_001661 [Heliosperma pusillum]|nr:hypothetical protein KSS87_001661 [Heliosperma pusillum]